MPSFTYRVARSDGAVMARRADSDNEAALRERLEGEGYLVLSIAEAAHLPAPTWFEKKGVSPRDFLAFNQELMVLLKAGLPIMKILDILMERGGRTAFSDALKAVQKDIREGGTIADAMAKHPAFFPEIYVSSLGAGEKSGNLVEVIGRFMAYQRRVIDVRKKVTAALAYPTFLLSFGILVLSFLLVFVMPKFSEMYAQASADLPWLTRALLGFVASVRGHIVLWAGGGILVVFLLWKGYQHPSGRALFDRVLLHIPIVGPIVRRHYLIQITRTLSTVLKSGIPLVGALKIMSDAMTSRSVRDRLAGVSDAVRSGGGLASALAKTDLFPRLSTEMIGVGEQTSALEEMLNDVGGFHEEELDLYLARVTTWVEPILLLGVGAIIAVILIAMYLPIFNLAGTVQ